MSNMLPFGELGEMATASFVALCFHTLYVLMCYGYSGVCGVWNQESNIPIILINE